MKINEKTYASFHKWYPLYKQLTFKSVIVDLPPEVVTYLNDDGVVLPVEAVGIRSVSLHSDDSSDDEDTSEWKDDETSAELETEQPSFPAFSQELQAAIEALGGDVIIKSSWSSPTDSGWITTSKTLKCSSIEDIYLLLKSSSRLQNDFNSLKDEDTRYIVIKKWEDIDPSTEFRCFVHNKSLIGISQRDCTKLYSYILEDKLDIIKELKEFFTKNLKETALLENYTFDVVRLAGGKITLVDVGEFDKTSTKVYLFTWDELNEISNSDREIDEPEFRFIATETGIQPSDGFQGFCIPYDLINVTCRRHVMSSLISLIENEDEE